jgi:uncharacterized protein YukE
MIFNFVRSAVQGVVSQAMSQANMAQSLMDQIKGFVPTVQGAWRGGDEKAFEAAVNRQLLPAMANVIAAISGFGGSLGKATDIMDQADGKVRGLADQLGDVFGGIF